MKKIKELLKTHKEIITYVFVGGMTTLVNWTVFISLTKIADVNDNIANIISVIIAVTFAFFANKFFVFHSKTDTKMAFFREMVLFGASRLVSALVEIFGFMLIIKMLEYVDFSLIENHRGMASKVFISVFIIILNYVLSKFIVFRKSKKKS
jgi:putative flippase GtrA